MAQQAYLVTHPPKQRQFKARGTDPSGVFVVHTAENTPDWVDHDAGAENVAGFIANRLDFGSYHWLVDSDSIILLVPLSQQAYGDATGTNPHAIHVSGATQAAKWNAAPKEWREEVARNMGVAAGRSARWLKSKHGKAFPPAERISKADSDNRKPGFIPHADRDPARRSDPGADFPWGLFFEEYEETVRPQKPTPQITAALNADSQEERRAALRKVMRHGEPKAQRTAERWLKNLRRMEAVRKRIQNSRENLKDLEVKP